MANKELLKSLIFETIDNQINQNDPKEVNQTVERLKNEGFNMNDIKSMIGQCLSIEIFNVMKNGEEYNETRYLTNLEKLPEEPFED